MKKKEMEKEKKGEVMKIEEEIKGKSIKDLITDMKDFTVLAIDFAYCSILFGSLDMAREVLKMEKKLDSIREEIEKAVLRAATTGIREEELVGILKLATYSERISDTAGDIARKVLQRKVHEVEKLALKEAEEKYVKFKVTKELKGRKIAEIADLKNVWIIAIKRGKNWLYHPSGKVEVKTADILFGVRP